MSNKISNPRHSLFEQIRKVDENGTEYRQARELSRVLEYTDFRNFTNVIDKAEEACRNSSQPIENHFVDINEMVGIGSGAERPLPSVKLSRYACYSRILWWVWSKGDTRQKGLKKNQKILDHTGSTELAANLFRATQAEDKLKREQIKGKTKANKAHDEVRAKVWQTIKELRGTMPENLLVAENIAKVETKQRKQLKEDNNE